MLCTLSRRWPALYSVVEDCMLKLLPAVRECAWLQTEGPLDSGAAHKRSSGGRQQSQIPRVLQAMEDFDAEVMQLCQLATRDGASAFDSIAGGVARPILKVRWAHRVPTLTSREASACGYAMRIVDSSHVLGLCRA